VTLFSLLLEIREATAKKIVGNNAQYLTLNQSL